MKKGLPLIIIGYSLSFIILIIAFLFSRRLYNLVDYSDKIEHTYRVRNQMLKVQSKLIEAESSQRAFILINDSIYFRPIKHFQLEILAEVDSLKRLFDTVQVQQEALINLKKTISSRFQLLYQTIEDADANDKLKFIADAKKGKELMNDFSVLTARMERVELDKLKESEEKKRALEKEAPLYLSAVLIISSLFQILSFIFITREFKRSRAYLDKLESKIHELNMTNAELEQITFVASHDLQEPLRKIRTFSDRLENKHKENLNEEGRNVVDRIVAAATRVQGLIEDLISFTRLIKTEEAPQPVDLNASVESVIADLKAVVVAKNAIINLQPLPTIEGSKEQLHLLFFNLLDNALKFVNPHVTPVINVSVMTVEGSAIDVNEKKLEGRNFYEISISDNGVGFDNDFKHKLFIIFQRLHTQNSLYQGKGVGLAICKRVMINHQGYITATGEPGAGSTFKIYFPVKPAF